MGIYVDGRQFAVPNLRNPQWHVPLISQSKNPIINQVQPLIWWRLVNSSPGVDCLVGFHIPLGTMNHQQRNCCLATLNGHRFRLLKQRWFWSSWWAHDDPINQATLVNIRIKHINHMHHWGYQLIRLKIFHHCKYIIFILKIRIVIYKIYHQVLNGKTIVYIP